MDKKLIEDLDAARGTRSDSSRVDAVTQVHLSGRMTARERLKLLLDEDSMVEYGSIAGQTSDGKWVAETGGVDFVGTINGQVVVASSTDYTDRGGGYGAGRLGRLFALAHEHRWPLVFFVDGGGSRARHPRSGLGHIEFSGPVGRFTIIDGNAELSGWVPTIAIVSGPSFAGHASLAAFSDFLIATKDSSIGLGGPPMVEAALGVRLSATELAGVDMHEVTGGIDLLVEDDTAAINAARSYLAYYEDHESGRAAETADRIDGLVPNEGAYDMRQVIQALVDSDSVFELRPRFATSLITSLARINGRTVGVLANQPLVDDGAIDTDAATKISRFIELCDSYEYPIVSLIDTPGCVSTWQPKGESEITQPIITRWHTRPIMAHQHRTVPLFSIIVRRGYGLGLTLMTGYSSARGVPPLCLAWPTMEVGHFDGFSTMRYSDAIDDVIAPSESREKISRLLRHLKRDLNRPAKKHPIDTW
ncbi:MAG: carboxyl transferase domain-containing protein [bacterium]